MTPEQAKKVRCCGPAPKNTGLSAPDPDNTKALPVYVCAAARCAAWRWREDKRTEAYMRAVVEHMKTTGDGYSKSIQEVLKRRDEFVYTEGFCGLAGGQGHAP